jgi:hypothetical protein
MVFERVAFVTLNPWEPNELERLVNLISSAFTPEVPRSHRERISEAADGSPRFVKNCFRKLVGSSSWDLDRIIAETSRELR